MRFSTHALLPFLRWFPYSATTLRADFIAGLTVALVLVPQSMAYAQLAGMPAYYGLYAGFLPVAVAALWGSSKQLGTGPVAVASLLTASSLTPLAAPGSDAFVTLAIMLALLVGLIQLALGLFRLGVVVNFLSHPVIVGFTNAAAIIGRRGLSRGIFLDRRVFLISYDPTQDVDGRIVENILLAAGPVGAGISLEYYFSTVDNERYGCGSKITHNLAGLMGVMEGASSDLRTGLPRQMIEIHEPMRLLVVLEQTRDIASAIVARQPPLQELVGNGWIVVAVKEPESGAIYLLDTARGWQAWSPTGEVPRARNSAEWLGRHREPLPPALLEPAC